MVESAVSNRLQYYGQHSTGLLQSAETVWFYTGNKPYSRRTFLFLIHNHSVYVARMQAVLACTSRDTKTTLSRLDILTCVSAFHAVVAARSPVRSLTSSTFMKFAVQPPTPSSWKTSELSQALTRCCNHFMSSILIRLGSVIVYNLHSLWLSFVFNFFVFWGRCKRSFCPFFPLAFLVYWFHCTSFIYLFYCSSYHYQ